MPGRRRASPFCESSRRNGQMRILRPRTQQCVTAQNWCWNTENPPNSTLDPKSILREHGMGVFTHDMIRGAIWLIIIPIPFMTALRIG